MPTLECPAADAEQRMPHIEEPQPNPCQAVACNQGKPTELGRPVLTTAQALTGKDC
jgi:hypothetical protein